MKKVEDINFSCFRLNLFPEFKHHYLCALSHLLQWIPKQVLLSEVPNVSIFFPNCALSHWLLRGHMTFKNWSVSGQKSRSPNITKSMTPVEKCFTSGINCRLRAISLFLSPLSETRETRKWPRAWLKARDGMLFFRLGLPPFVSRVSPHQIWRKRETARSLHNSIFVIFIFPQLMPLLIQSLSCEEQTLKQSTLQTMYSLVLDAPEIITRHVTSLVPMFLGLSKFQLSMVSGTTGGGITYYNMVTNRNLCHESDHTLPSYKTSFRSCLFRLAATHENIKGLSLNGV